MGALGRCSGWEKAEGSRQGWLEWALFWPATCPSGGLGEGRAGLAT